MIHSNLVLCLLYLPSFILSFGNGLVALKRINTFLELEEVEKSDCKENLSNKNASVIVTDLTSSYYSSDSKYLKEDCKNDKNILEEKNEKMYSLQNLNFDVKSGEILILIAEVGSGKSLVLLSILGKYK